MLLEAIMLAGLTFKRKWPNKMKALREAQNHHGHQHVPVCWEKFIHYLEVGLKELKLREGYYVMDLEKGVEIVDKNTISVAAILGSKLNNLLMVKNDETGCVMRAFFLPGTIVDPRCLQQTC
jgi:glutamate decarboxylase